jgi:hypothetical protein
LFVLALKLIPLNALLSIMVLDAARQAAAMSLCT